MKFLAGGFVEKYSRQVKDRDAWHKSAGPGHSDALHGTAGAVYCKDIGRIERSQKSSWLGQMRADMVSDTGGSLIYSPEI